MKYICVRIYGNGQFVNQIYPNVYSYYSTAELACKSLNKKDQEGTSNEQRWIVLGVTEDTTCKWRDKYE